MSRKIVLLYVALVISGYPLPVQAFDILTLQETQTSETETPENEHEVRLTYRPQVKKIFKRSPIPRYAVSISKAMFYLASEPMVQTGERMSRVPLFPDQFRNLPLLI